MEQSNLPSRALLIFVFAGLMVWAFLASGIRLGQDLKGGMTLRFSLDIEGAKKSGRVDAQMPSEEIVSQTLGIINDRINKYGLAEVNLAQYGEDQFLVSLPAGATSLADGIIGVISQLGDLKFRIEVRPDSMYTSGEDGAPRRTNVWEGTAEQYSTFMEAEQKQWRAARERGEEYVPTNPKYRLVKYLDREAFILVEEVNFPGKGFDGGILTNPVVGRSDLNRPVVWYEVKNDFQNDFGVWTEANIKLPMAIILNDQVKSAPIIQDKLTKNVQITLGTGSNTQLEKEAKELVAVLQTGSLKIQPVLEAKQVMGPSLAGQSRERGILAVIVAFIVVLLFMVVYYRVSGLIANVALLLNLVMLVGFMAFFQAVLTLPGIAGIVLTVGIAVDANILINERIREERRAGRSLQRAMSEGYDRALSAIIDANVTSIITAIFLYNFGSGPVRGFAVTLAIGLMISMFTSIFVTRTIFEWLIRTGVIKEITALGSGEPRHINWLSLRRIFGPLSVAGIVFGLVMFFTTDKYTLYDIDFTGGYKMHAAFKTKTSPDEIGDLLATTHRDITVNVTRFENNEKVTHPVTVKVGPYPTAQVLSAGEDGKGVEINVQRLFTDSQKSEDEQALAFQKYVRDLLADRLMPDWTIKNPETYTYVAPAGAPDTADPLEAVSGGLHTIVAFQDPIGVLDAPKLESILESDMPFWVREDGRDVPYAPADKGLKRAVVVKAYPVDAPTVAAFEIWLKSTTSGGQSAESDPITFKTRLGEYLGGSSLKDRLKKDIPEKDYATLENEFGLSQPFPSEDHIGSTHAEKLRDDAFVALFLSLVGIIIYIALRFRSRAMGFSAVLCLFHDVAITMGIVALANSLGLVDAKINLAMVAAFLTLVGYSVNDTVVIFDRIRENRGKRPTIDETLINLSINQTLARTIRTTATFLLVCIALFAFNYGQRNVLEGFSFVLILGSIIGTYSTIAISTPLLLFLPWIWERTRRFAPKGSIVTKFATHPATLVLVPVAAVAWLAWAVVFGLGAFVVGLALFVPWSLKAERSPSDPYARKVAPA